MRALFEVIGILWVVALVGFGILWMIEKYNKMNKGGKGG